MEDAKKVWHVIDVASDSNVDLEKKLNELALKGLQIFRIDDAKKFPNLGYRIMAFNPLIMQELASAMMGQTLQNIMNSSPFKPGR